MDPDPTKLDKNEMAKEMIDALRGLGVPVDQGGDGWRKLLQGISEGIIVHLAKHDQALTIPRDGTATTELNHDHDHDHGSHIVVQR